MPQSPSELLARMRSVSPSSPRLVWHGRDGRIELSGRVFDNWVAKSSNLLVDELDATDATTVTVDLPVHWKTLALVFACWQVGAVVVLPDAVAPADAAHEPAAGGGLEDDADVVLSAHNVPRVKPPRQLVCVALASLALRWDGQLPPGAVDFAAEVRSHGDVYFGVADDPDDTPLVRTGGTTLTAAQLGESAALPMDPDNAATDAAPTLLVGPEVGLLRVLAAALDVWQRDGALVLVEEGVPITDRLLAGERVTGRLGTV